MTTDREDYEALLTDRLREVSEALLHPAQVEPFVTAVGLAFTHGHTIAVESLDPRHDVEAGATALLLLVGSTRATDPGMATALVEAARAHAAVWAMANQVAAFRQQLDATDGLADG